MSDSSPTRARVVSDTVYRFQRLLSKLEDLDFFVCEEDAERALAALKAAGLQPERPPEGWLVKAWGGGILIDLMFNHSGGPFARAFFTFVEELAVVEAA